MEVVELVETMRNICMDLHAKGKQIRFVPTMGSLHLGHTSLIKRASEQVDEDDGNFQLTSSKRNQTSHESNRNFVIIVSIFVNPTQFNNRLDFLKYPKNLDKDLEICRQTQLVDFVFVPTSRDIYKFSNYNRTTIAENLDPSQRCRVVPPLNPIALDLEGKSRPGHFQGMLTVVNKLFNIMQPDWAYFGEKDYQQLLLVSHMVDDLSMRTRICGVETVREPDTKLPMSSRNVRLTGEQRESAAIMFDILQNAREALEQKCCQKSILNYLNPSNEELEIILLSSVLASQCVTRLNDYDSENADVNSVKIDYLELRCAKDLTVIRFDRNLQYYDCELRCAENSSKVDSNDSIDVLKARLLISVIVADIRLLDNMEVELNLARD